jgi:hypothetical protein
MKCPYCHSLRHDLVIIGRVAATPLPENFATRLGPLLARLAECTSKSLNESASALALRRAPPTLKPMEDALPAYNSEIAALRSEGLTLALSIAGAGTIEDDIEAPRATRRSKRDRLTEA